MRTLWKKLIGSHFIQDVILLQCGTTVTIILQGGCGIVLARLLGPEKLGLYTVALTIVATIGLLTSIGQSQSFTTLLAEGYGKQSKQAVQSAVGYYLHIFFWWTVPISVCSLIVSIILVVTQSSAAQLSLWVALGIVPFFFAPVSDIMTTTLQCKRQISTLTGIEILFSILDAISIFIVLIVWPQNITVLMLSKIFTNICRAILSLVFLQNIMKTDPLFPRGYEIIHSIKAKMEWPIFRLGLWIAADGQVSKFMWQTPIYLIGAFGSIEQVGLYKVFMSYIDFASKLSGGVGRMMSSVLPHMYMSNPRAFNRSFWKGNIGNMCFMYLTLIPLLFLGNSGLHLFFGPKYSVPSFLFPLMLLWGLNGITVGFASFYRIHRALHLSVLLLLVSGLLSLVVWYGLLLWSPFDVFTSTVLYFVCYSTIGKVLHAGNFYMLNRRKICDAQGMTV